MKKSKKCGLGILVTVLVYGLTVVGCDDGNGDNNNGGSGVNLPTIYQNTTWMNTGDDDYRGNYYSKISFKTTSATIYRDDGTITDLTGTVYNVKEVGQNNYYTTQLGTNMSQIYMVKPVPPSKDKDGDNVAEQTVAVYIFVKDDGTGLFVQTLGRPDSNITEQNWIKQ